MADRKHGIVDPRYKQEKQAYVDWLASSRSHAILEEVVWWTIFE